MQMQIRIPPEIVEYTVQLEQVVLLTTSTTNMSSVEYISKPEYLSATAYY